MILISVYPEHVEIIKEGIKKYEFRKIPSKKTKATLRKIKYLAIYETMPTSAITLILKIGEVFEDNIITLWNNFGEKAGISKDYFMGYYSGKIKGIAIEIKDFLILKKPISLQEIRVVYPKFIPPQNSYQLSGDKYPFLYQELLRQILKSNF